MRSRTLKVRRGESLLIQANAESADGRKLANGELVQVARIQKRGVIDLVDGRTIPASFRQFTYGYAVTSHASQGLTVDHVLLAMDSQSGPAVNRKQFYDSSSRGREGLRIYTDDAESGWRTNLAQRPSPPGARSYRSRPEARHSTRDRSERRRKGRVGGQRAPTSDDMAGAVRRADRATPINPRRFMAIKKDITDRRPPIDQDGLCWRTFSRNQRGVLRVELCSGKTFLLPYMNWGHAHLEKVDGREELTIKFHSHEVRVEGEHLRELLIELQASNVELLRETRLRRTALLSQPVLPYGDVETGVSVGAPNGEC